MKTLKKIVKSETAPADTDVLWLNTTDGVLYSFDGREGWKGTSEDVPEGLAQESTSQKILGKVNTLTALDSDIASGKSHIAAAISQKGVPTSVEDSLVAMATNISQIQQQINTGVSDFEQVIAPSPYIWNVYVVANDIMSGADVAYLPSYLTEYKQRYGTNAFFVGEYYLGYESLELTGADAYLTCDGDFYTITDDVVTHTLPDGTVETYSAESIIHQWHDSNSGRCNRWVAFFYLSNSYTFVNTSVNICPRRVAICGNCLSFVVSGENRLTSVWVIGILGHFEGGMTGDSWDKAQVIRNYKSHSSGIMYSKFYGNSLVLPDLEEIIGSGQLVTSENSNVANSPSIICLPELKTFNSIYALLLARNAGEFKSGLFYLSIPKLTEINTPLITESGQTANHFNTLKTIRLDLLDTINLTSKGGGHADRPSGLVVATYQRDVLTQLETIYMPKLSQITNGYILVAHSNTLGYSFSNLIDIEVGAMVTSLDLRYWLPTNVLADTTQGGKRDQLIQNIKNHILLRISDNSSNETPLVFYVSQSMWSDIKDETITWEYEGDSYTESISDAFARKGWSFAGA